MLDLVKTVRDIGENSSQIGKIIKIIEAIVFQTNILALNAAVENGTRIADETVQSLLSAVEGTKEIISQINQIAAASSEQAKGAAKVQLGIDQISNVLYMDGSRKLKKHPGHETFSSVPTSKDYKHQK